MNCFHAIYTVFWSSFILQKRIKKKYLLMSCSYFSSLPPLAIKPSHNVALLFKTFLFVPYVLATLGNLSSLNSHKIFPLLCLCLIPPFFFKHHPSYLLSFSCPNPKSYCSFTIFLVLPLQRDLFFLWYSMLFSTSLLTIIFILNASDFSICPVCSLIQI